MLEVKTEELEFSFPNDTPIVYRLCRIDENGIPRPTSDEELMEVESLIQADYSDSEREQSDDDKEEEEEPYDMEDASRRLLKKLEVQVVDIASKFKAEAAVESSNSGYNGTKYTYKRRRRPNPKYFLPHHPVHHQVAQSEYQLVEVKTEPTSRGFTEEEGICSTSKAATPVVPVQTPQAPPPQPQPSQPPQQQQLQQNQQQEASSHHKCLDHLSIRELQDTFRDTFGRETSAKDKLWLKRKISKGLGEANRVQDVVMTQRTQEYALTDRMDIQPSAEQPCVMETTVDFEQDESKYRYVACSTISPTASLDASTTTVVSRPSEGQSHLNEAQSLEGKRHRKPNRRYLEDEMETDELGYGKIVSSPETEEQQDPQDQAEYTVSQYENSDDGADDADMDLEPFDIDEELSLDGSPRKRNRGGFGEQKAERRAAQLVKLARNARAARRDTGNTSVRKIKFKIPAAQDNDENYEPHEDSGDQVSCMLPNVSSDELQPSDTEDTDTRKGGSRRKHHRPWTLREVVALVDGVSRCGTGKWADIKRMSFASIHYRTPVDLKDKWRNLLRASRVHSHSSRQQQGEKRRKHFSVSIPANILARVRELAAQPGQTLKLPVIRSTRSRRMKKQNVELD